MEEPKKPKRQLTEAQRLAFLEGRKKRLANIERKKQEQEESKKKEEEKQEIVQEETQIEPPERPPTPMPPSSVDEDASAKKIADFVFERIRAIKEEERKMNEEIVPLPKPKARKPRQIKKKSPPISPIVEEKTIEEPIPQRSFMWM